MLSQDNLEHFRRALAVALRTTREADDSLNDRFVELRPGMLGTLELRLITSSQDVEASASQRPLRSFSVAQRTLAAV